jgi:hypothetical protein
MKRTSFKKKKSQRQADFDAELDRMRPIIHARSNGQCEAARIVAAYGTWSLAHEDREQVELAIASFNEVRCWKRAGEVHHRKYRKRAGTNNLDNLAHLCLAHHAWAHRNGGFGRAANLLGLALSSGQSEVMPLMKGEKR